MAPRFRALYALYERKGTPPWEVLGVRWKPRAMRAWYFAAQAVSQETMQEMRRKQELTQHEAEVNATLKGGTGTPTARRRSGAPVSAPGPSAMLRPRRR